MLRIELDEIKRWRNAREFHTVPRASCNKVEVVGWGLVVKRLCEQLAQQNTDLNEIVEVWRGDTPVFNPMTLKRWVTKGKPVAQRKPKV